MSQAVWQQTKNQFDQVKKIHDEQVPKIRKAQDMLEFEKEVEDDKQKQAEAKFDVMKRRLGEIHRMGNERQDERKRKMDMHITTLESSDQVQPIGDMPRNLPKMTRDEFALFMELSRQAYRGQWRTANSYHGE